ncbi:hypothetical protein PAECIP111894_01663 [Paenibacillus pseudetheri]|uniref:Uncharacterized protein n=1 Tax=Paenibacillus pseudetheri TaxID=2897682 RepID=A0ABN8FJ74_9BACL|nr:hypothetical protein PAECIP111894_01663 [Paenibacillus pseudetheri]
MQQNDSRPTAKTVMSGSRPEQESSQSPTDSTKYSRRKSKPATRPCCFRYLNPKDQKSYSATPPVRKKAERLVRRIKINIYLFFSLIVVTPLSHLRHSCHLLSPFVTCGGSSACSFSTALRLTFVTLSPFDPCSRLSVVVLPCYSWVCIGSFG